MSELNWEPAFDGALLAQGETWTYLITRDSRLTVLTRYSTSYSGPGRAGREKDAVRVAREAALYAIQIGGAWDIAPDTTEAITGHLRQAAQDYESGQDITGQPAWRH